MRTKHLYQNATVGEVTARIARLRPDSSPQWGTMQVAQALAHCALSFEMALGEINPPRMWLGRILGPLAKRSLIVRGEPMRRNAPTTRPLLVSDEREFLAERERLCRMIDRFVGGGPSQCTTHPHPFVGPLTPTEWATLMYQHLDHHLRQFEA